MTEPNTHVRLSLLNVPADLTALKFRSWIREEAADIDRRSIEAGMRHSLTVIRLFLPARLHSAIGWPKLDRLLQEIVDRFETIHRVELRVVEAALSIDEMDAESKLAEAELQALAKEQEDDSNNGGGPTVH